MKKKQKKIKYLELFAGIGGFRIAIEKAAKANHLEAECVGYSEIDLNAIKTYQANFKNANNELALGDITSLRSDAEIKNLPNFNMLFAGFPCQPFSLMGAKKGFIDSRGILFFQIAKILKIKKPEFFILENVRGIKTHDGGRTFKKIMRLRLWFLGYIGDQKTFPQIEGSLDNWLGIKSKKLHLKK